MTEADVIQPSASVASTGFGIRYIGDWAYAYSGLITVNNDTVTQLEFTTGTGVMVAKYQFFTDIESISSNRTIGFNIKLNSVLVIESVYFSSATTAVYDIDIPVELIIPPLTKVTIESVTSNTNDMSTYGTLTGRVYGAT